MSACSAAGNTMVLLAALAQAACGPPPVEQIVARSAEAMLGPAGLDTVRTLRVTTTYPDHAYPVINEIRRPNQLRTEGVGSYVLAFDGRRAAFLQQPPGDDGTRPAPALIEPAYVRDLELDIAWIVPAYLDYPAEYIRTTEQHGVRVHEVLVVLPGGIRVTYAIDAGTYLPVEARADVTVDSVTYHPFRRFHDYRRNRSGVTYAHSFTYAWVPEDVHTATVDSVEVNPALPAGRFAIPEALR